MTPESFIAWRILMRHGTVGHVYGYGAPLSPLLRPLSEQKTADALGASRTAIRGWSRKGAPLYIALACSAILHGLPAWEQHKA